MRTTVDIDPDLAARLRAITHERDISLKEAINEALRAGLTPSAGAARRYKVRARPMGLRRGIDLDKARLHRERSGGRGRSSASSSSASGAPGRQPAALTPSIRLPPAIETPAGGSRPSSPARRRSPSPRVVLLAFVRPQHESTCIEEPLTATVRSIWWTAGSLNRAPPSSTRQSGMPPCCGELFGADRDCREPHDRRASGGTRARTRCPSCSRLTSDYSRFQGCSETDPLA